MNLLKVKTPCNISQIYCFYYQAMAEGNPPRVFHVYSRKHGLKAHGSYGKLGKNYSRPIMALIRRDAFYILYGCGAVLFSVGSGSRCKSGVKHIFLICYTVSLKLGIGVWFGSPTGNLALPKLFK